MSGDVVELIMQDHREVERLFEALRTDPAKRPGLVPVLTTLLAAHSRAEEAEVYPAAADEAGASDDVEHSQEEHVEADELLAQLADADPTSEAFDQILNKVIDAVTHHVEEEESSVLPAIKERLSDQRRAELGEAFLASRAEHLGDQPDDITKAELEQQAANLDLPGASGMSKEELQQALREKAESA
jgi:hemerythrin superfamily protein